MIKRFTVFRQPWSILVVAMSLVIAGSARGDDDPAPERSEWEGKQQQEGVKNGRLERTSAAVKIVITERKEKAFKAEYTQDGAGVLELAGTIDKAGKVKWDVRRIIKGQEVFSKDLVGGLIGTGTLKGKKMSLKWSIKGTTQRGKIDLELKE